jgi:hypothetical protein
MAQAWIFRSWSAPWVRRWTRKPFLPIYVFPQCWADIQPISCTRRTCALSKGMLLNVLSHWRQGWIDGRDSSLCLSFTWTWSAVWLIKVFSQFGHGKALSRVWDGRWASSRRFRTKLTLKRKVRTLQVNLWMNSQFKILELLFADGAGIYCIRVNQGVSC